jgi:hypothetical protein
MDYNRLSKELKNFKKSIGNGSLPGIVDLTLVEDSLNVWQFWVTADALDQDLDALNSSDVISTHFPATPTAEDPNTTTSKAAYDIVINSEPAEVIERAAPTVEERLAAANAKTGLHLLPSKPLGNH